LPSGGFVCECQLKSMEISAAVKTVRDGNRQRKATQESEGILIWTMLQQDSTVAVCRSEEKNPIRRSLTNRNRRATPITNRNRKSRPMRGQRMNMTMGIIFRTHRQLARKLHRRSLSVRTRLTRATGPASIKRDALPWISTATRDFVAMLRD